MADDQRIVSRETALEATLNGLTEADTPPFLSDPAKRDAIARLGISQFIDPSKLIEYVRTNSGIPEKDYYDPGCDNPYFRKVQDLIRAYSSRTPKNSISSVPYAGALKALLVVWNYRDQLPAEKKAQKEHLVETWLDTGEAGERVKANLGLGILKPIRTTADEITEKSE